MEKCRCGKHEGQKGCLKRCSLLDELTRKVEKMEAERMEYDLSAVADVDAWSALAKSTVVDNQSDPMAQLDPLEGDFETPRKKEKKPKPSKSIIKRKKNQIYTVEHSLWPELLKDKPSDLTQIEVLFLSSKSLYVHVKHLEWLVRYVASEANLGGVQQESCKRQKVRECNCSVPGLYIEWDFKSEGYSAEFVAGPFQGESVFSAAAALTEEKYNAVADRLQNPVSFDDAKHKDIKEATLQYLLRYCENMLGK